MRTLESVTADLRALGDEKYRPFNERIANIRPGSSIGVRMPQLRTYAKALVREEGFSLQELFLFPNDVYEIRLLKALCVGYCKLDFAERIAWIPRVIEVMDSWAVCDAFCSTLRIPMGEKRNFLQDIEYYVRQKTEFSQRFAYVCMRVNYVEEEYLPFIASALDCAEVRFYYTHMGAAWLLSEVLVRYFDRGVEYLRVGALADATKNKAIQKACESYRLTAEQKNFLKLLKKG